MARLPLWAGAGALIGMGLAARQRLLRLGATGDEARRVYPGDELVPDADGQSTMATTLPAPPEQVWPWLVQMGCDRAGWYSWDRADNAGRPSADRLVPQWQDLAEGDRIASTPDGRSWFTVARLDPLRTLVLRADLEVPSGRPFDPSGPLPRAFTEAVWSFHLTGVPDGDGVEGDGEGATRLVVRTRYRSRPRLLMGTLDLGFWEPAHVIMQTAQFRHLAERVRGTAGADPETGVVTPG